ncbi:CDGSH iron-sulfur domain-containing protein [Candidatus Methylospira mobilis]|uniref:CDGSH iron-sulfur domain-containing protein n=1 Tax=Candidatus Methylospira mobilis TaxID=1808979 RepID=A0A5Q0BCT6_9GAMM|nr:CDGSH iron-sulfur domain-containing protein [Candidatus Methylospira mobilis]QFY41733.1 CDGSH iron-sulfur domain-containing protein [Candidatus Methylospira mobilis]WNV06589.1 CDGSH iron-sulfur domain-containing protein [Candidatus Methylospira mobilis]
MADEEPVIAQKAPYAVAVETGKSYWYCTCGKTESQPFCDGAHKGTGFRPVEYKAEQDEVVYFCGCRQSANGVTCDGAHGSL